MIRSIYCSRDAICEAYSLRDSKCSSISGLGGEGCASIDTTNIHAAGIEAGKIMSAVDNQPKEMKDWLLWAYGPISYSLKHREAALDCVCERVDFSEWCNGRRDAMKVRGSIIVEAAMMNHRATSLDVARKYRKPAHWNNAVRQISGGQVGICTNQFNREYSALIERVDTACHALDAVSLGPVSAALAQVRAYRGEAAA